MKQGIAIWAKRIASLLCAAAIVMVDIIVWDNVPKFVDLMREYPELVTRAGALVVVIAVVVVGNVAVAAMIGSAWVGPRRKSISEGDES